MPHRADPIPLRTLGHVLGLSLAVAVGYYVGVTVGLALKLPDATPSVMWPPNAILTATLLLVPVRLWPVVLLSALPAHLTLERGTDWPMTLSLMLFATNCSEALIGASLVRRWSDAPTRFDSQKRLLAFVGGAVIAGPFFSSFVDAAAVSLVRGEDYWQVWGSRVISNTLTELTLVPAIVLTVTHRGWLRSASTFRRLEATALVLSIAVVGIVQLQGFPSDSTTPELSNRAAFAWLLPLLVWAAVRFGPAGASLSAVVSALMLVGAAINSHGPFHGLPPAEATLGIQLALIPGALALLVVGVAVEERRLAQRSLSERLAFEGLLSRLSGAFVLLPSDRMPSVFNRSLQGIGEFMGFDAMTLLSRSHTTGELETIADWTSNGSHAVLARLREGVAEVVDRPSILEDVTFVPDGTPSLGISGVPRSRTILTVPLHEDGRPIGVLGCAGRTPAADWSPHVVRQAQIIGDILASALARKRTEDALRASEAVKSAFLSSLTSGVVVVDNSGRIITVNDRWRSWVGASAPPEATRPGADYLQFYRDMAGSGVAWAADAATGIESVARGARTDFTLEHYADDPRSGRWFAVRAVPLDRSEGGAVVTHTDISTQRRAEMETERMRAELAHVLRASTTAALAASIAHQLNQPLTGIVTNARAAERFLDAVEPDLDESRASLRDIADDGKRAGEIIVRLRAFLQQDDGQTANVDMNRIVGEVVGLVSSDVRVGNTSIEMQLEQEQACVEANPTQLRQLLLNLLVNALEAVGDSPSSDRRVITRCTLTGPFIELSIVDNGAGFTATAIDDVFDAFYTTKARGMGLGLFIARSIVEGHGGTIGARNNPDRGATVWFTLPRAACGAA